jgi:hypothetical protein
VLSGLAHVQASANLADTGVKVDASMVASSPEDAARAARFFKALAASLASSPYAELAKATTVDLVDFTVLLRMVIPTKVVLGLLVKQGSSSSPAASAAAIPVAPAPPTLPPAAPR